MAATSVDENHGLFPVAYAICEEENGETWTWFLECLKEAIRETEGLIFLSDMNIKLASWEATRAFTRLGFDIALEKIQKVDECAAKYLSDIKAVWSRHQFGSSGNRGLDILQFIDPCYFTKSFRATYEMRVNSLVDRALWEHVDLPYTVLLPLSRRPRGRPKKKRIRDSNEQKKIKRMHNCGRCCNLGHHKATCKEPLKIIESQGTRSLPRTPNKQQPWHRASNRNTMNGSTSAGDLKNNMKK
ncbi:hypothetical protein QJS10_CPB19g00242 [Acorus calamus]|uniref:MULE transposase domain-containing protein n=1 Tax=Acorus calamus TaxID=4465 RepID=A0AAV9CKA6_ACOCL|nr:hypothetical protein QJS10_CPB19g00242 [Acorus calamus]